METLATELNEEQQNWLGRIRQLEQRIDQLSGQNGEIAARISLPEMVKQVEHFQNQFIIQKDRLDEMKHNVKLFKSNPGLADYEAYLNGLIEEFNDFPGSVN